MSDSQWALWVCSQCHRRVPWRHPECRCGGFRAQASTVIQPGQEATGSSRRWLGALALCAAAAALGVVWWRVVDNMDSSGRVTTLGRQPRLTAADVPLRGQPEATGPRTLPPTAPPALSVSAPAMPAPPVPRQWSPASPAAPPPAFPFAAEPPPSTAAAEAPPATAPPERLSEIDRARQQGRAQLESKYQAIASSAVQLVGEIEAYRANCSRETPDEVCHSMLQSIGRTAYAVGTAMDEAEEICRKAWLEPGVIRQMREEYGLDDAYWDKLASLVRKYRR